MFAFGKNKELRAKIEKYLRIATETMESFEEAVRHLHKKGFDEHFEILVEKTNQNESNADDNRRMIEAEMYEKSLLPETREDILLIIELLDKIPSQAKRVLNNMVSQRVKPLGDLKKEMLEAVKLGCETFQLVTQATIACVGTSREKIEELSRKIDNNESLGDMLEKDMTTKIFQMKMDTGDKILHRDIVREIGELLDLCENAIDRIVILSVKRHI